MAINFSKKTWAKGDYVTPTPLNRMEQGIKDACDGVDTLNSQIMLTQYDANASDWQGAVLELLGKMAAGQSFSGHVRYGTDHSNGFIAFGYKVNSGTSRWMILMRTSTRVYSVRTTSSSAMVYKEMNGGSDTNYPA